MKNIMRVCVIAIVLLSGRQVFSQDYQTTIEYIQETKKLWGISSCAVNGDGSITLVDRRDSGIGHMLWFYAESDNVPEKVILKKGEYCELTDGHHVSITYKFIRLDNKDITIEVTDKFDARSFGRGIKKERKRVVINPYSE